MEAQAQHTAAVIAQVVVHRNVHEEDFGPPGLTPGELKDMQLDVEELRRSRELIGLEVWRIDGTPVFTNDGHPSAEARLPDDELQRVRQDQPWTVHTAASPRGQPTLDVFLPYEASDTPDGSLGGAVKVILPQRELMLAVQGATRYFDEAALAVVLLFGAGLFGPRRGLRRREHQVRHDPLTGLLNRGALVEDGNRMLSGAGNEHVCALLVLDLDGFQSVNDTLGHIAGDLLLVQVGEALLGATRGSDLVVRLGGDEFAVLMPDVPSAEQAHDRARQLLDRLRGTPFTVCGVALSVDASIGIAVGPGHGDEVAQLMQHADVAMYQAKRSRSGTAMYDAATDHHDVGQLAVLVELREAIEQDQLVLHYQPKIALPSQRVTGVEALVRWQHPTRGLLFPDAFLPPAEGTGLIQP